MCWCCYQNQHICQRGWWVWLFLMKISWSYSSCSIFVRGGLRRWWICWSLMKINLCDYPIQHICHEGWRIYNPLWIKHIQVDGITPFHVSWRWWWWWWGWGWGWRDHGNDGDDGDHHHHSCIVIWNVKHHLDDDDDCKCGAMSELDGACLTPMDLAQTGRKFNFRYLFMCFKFQIAVVFQEIWQNPQNKPCACSFMINKKSTNHPDRDLGKSSRSSFYYPTLSIAQEEDEHQQELHMFRWFTMSNNPTYRGDFSISFGKGGRQNQEPRAEGLTIVDVNRSNILW